MRESKRRRLAEKGWATGSVKDFLGLSKEEEAYIELRIKLADGLKSKRQSKGVTQIELAQSLKSSQSRVAKMEAGDPTVSLDLLVKSLLPLEPRRSSLPQSLRGAEESPNVPFSDRTLRLQHAGAADLSCARQQLARGHALYVSRLAATGCWAARRVLQCLT